MAQCVIMTPLVIVHREFQFLNFNKFHSHILIILSIINKAKI